MSATCVVYVAAADKFTGPTKFGITTNADRRMRQLNTGYPGPKYLRMLFSVSVPTVLVGRLIERRVREYVDLVGFEIKGEWAQCDPAYLIGCVIMATQDERRPPPANDNDLPVAAQLPLLLGDMAA